MKAGKAYISSLGTTGLLIASSLLLLVVVGTLIAFDQWPSGESVAAPDTVAIGESQPARKAAPEVLRERKPASEKTRERRERRAARREAERRARADTSGGPKGDDAGGPAGGRPVAGGGNASPGAGNGGGSGGAGAGAPSTGRPGSGGETIRQIGSGVSTVHPEVGQAVQGTAETVAGEVGEVVDQVLPGSGTQGGGSGLSAPVLP